MSASALSRFVGLRPVGAGHSEPRLRNRGGHDGPAPGLRPRPEQRGSAQGLRTYDTVRKLYGVS
jgi:hypothetical protein